MKLIKLIDINKIHHHPDNPRKDLGDLTELAESIKQSGVLQNLTLVPIGEKEGEFYAVIGNRRLAASKLAKLTKLPCAIVDMDYKTQVATMLLENMQRVDLTIYEQAQGFQMMIDLGESIKDISDKTGFSESTVRRRTKLLDLDQEKLKESDKRGGTLTDYMQLEQIESEELRNEVLETIGTDNFDWKIREAITQEKKEKEFKRAIEKISEFAKQIEDEESMTYVTGYHDYNFDEIETPADWKEEQYYFKPDKGSWIRIYKESTINDEEEKEKERLELERVEREEKKARLEEIRDRSYELRCEFVEGISNTKARRHMDEIIEATIYGMIHGRGVWISDVAKTLGIEIDEDDRANGKWESIQQEIWKQPEKNLLTLVYDSLDNGYQDYFKWDLTYVENEDLDYVYEFLEKLGYKLSEEERQIKEGTHELFIDVKRI